jgi:isopropylmalate/homocitrate/citramalate synthase
VTDLPRKVIFHEEGPREGFQIEKGSFSIEDRAALVDALAASGLEQVQVGSFVSPKAIPSMADIDKVFAAIKPIRGVRYTALWLNESGYRRALGAPNIFIDGKILLYNTEAFSQRNNNCSVAEMRKRQAQWVDLYLADGFQYESAYILTAFGCNYEGDVPLQTVVETSAYALDLARERGLPLPRIILADTVGWANPEEVKRRVGAVRDLAPDAPIGMHLHDTRGMGAANFYAALEMGVDMFDSSVAGLGGCPYANHANQHGAGNICTEDMVLMCQEMGIETGIDLPALLEAAQLAERVIGRPLSGKSMHAGLPKHSRGTAGHDVSTPNRLPG